MDRNDSDPVGDVDGDDRDDQADIEETDFGTCLVEHGSPLQVPHWFPVNQLSTARRMGLSRT